MTAVPEPLLHRMVLAMLDCLVPGDPQIVIGVGRDEVRVTWGLEGLSDDTWGLVKLDGDDDA